MKGYTGIAAKDDGSNNGTHSQIGLACSVQCCDLAAGKTRTAISGNAEKSRQCFSLSPRCDDSESIFQPFEISSGEDAYLSAAFAVLLLLKVCRTEGCPAGDPRHHASGLYLGEIANTDGSIPGSLFVEILLPPQKQ